MKSTKRSLLASGASLLLSAALLAGSTFAWFTDSVTNTGNTIQAGSLKVDFEYKDLVEDEAYQPVPEDAATAGKLFTKEIWEPGYSYGYDFKVSNTGSLALDWELSFQNIVCTDGTNGAEIADVLDVYVLPVNATSLEGATPIGTLSQLENGVVKSGEDLIATTGTEEFSVVLKMQEGANNDYQKAKVTFDVYLRAKQATVEEDGFGNNTYDENAEWPTIPVGGTVESLEKALEEAEPGTVLELPAVTYNLEAPLTIPSGVTLKGAQAGKSAQDWANDPETEKTIITAPTDESRVIKIEQNENETVQDVVLDGIMVDGNDQDVKGIFVKKYDGQAMTGIVIRNCAVVDCGNDGIDVNNTNGAIIENNYVESIYDNGIQLTSYNNTENVVSYIRNNVVKNIGGTSNGGGTINGAIAVSGGKGDVVVTNNTVENVDSQGQVALPNVDMGESAIVVESVNEGGIITIENNSLKNVQQGIAVYKFSAPTVNDKVIIRNNTVADAETFAIATSTLNYSKLSKTVVEITKNSFSGNSPAKEYIYIEKTNRYSETTANWQVDASGNTSGNGTYISES